LDKVQLQASGTGTFSWTPAINIINANTSSPTVSPATTTKYYVTLSANGCIGKDSVTVRPANDLTASISGIDQICAEDTITLTGNS